MTRARLTFVALLCLISSSAWADLRIYDVDFQYRQEIFRALNELLQVAGQPDVRYGRVELLPTGQILVNAEPETLDEVEQLLRAIRARPPGATPRARGYDVSRDRGNARRRRRNRRIPQDAGARTAARAAQDRGSGCT